jgi:hypothetical protein
MTNTREGMTLEQSMLGKHISGFTFSLCLETWIQIKVKATVSPGDIALESKNRTFEYIFVCHSYSMSSNDYFALRESSKFN